MTALSAFLEDRGVLRVSGDDAPVFLQGLVTNDVGSLAPGAACYSALLSPQGKLLFDFIVQRESGEPASFLLDCAADQAAALATRLGFYRLRAKVRIEDLSSELGVGAFWGGEPDAKLPGAAFPDPRDPRLGFRAILPRPAATALGAAAVAAYEAHRIALGVPKGGADFSYGDAFPHDVNMDVLHGLDFEKGCYVGQEVVSRMRHRANLRKRIVRVSFKGTAPTPGTPVLDGEMPVGLLGSAAGGIALAQMRIDRAEDARAAGRSLSASGAPVEVMDAGAP